MREALIVCGGWNGHEPEQGADIIVAMMREDQGFKVWIETSTEAFADPALKDLSLIVPIMTMSKIEKEELDNLTAAVRGGVGLAGYHGGMCDAFRDASTTSSCAAASGSPIPAASSTIGSTSPPDDPMMGGIDKLPLPFGAVLHARRSIERGAGDDDILR